MQKAGVTAPIVGATKLSHLQDAIAALSIRLDETEIAALEEQYVPHPVAGFS
jgi:aryl-alcohol dehydrogenase-like predicted oxidoreductase